MTKRFFLYVRNMVQAFASPTIGNAQLQHCLLQLAAMDDGMVELGPQLQGILDEAGYGCCLQRLGFICQCEKPSLFSNSFFVVIAFLHELLRQTTHHIRWQVFAGKINSCASRVRCAAWCADKASYSSPGATMSSSSLACRARSASMMTMRAITAMMITTTDGDDNDDEWTLYPRIHGKLRFSDGMPMVRAAEIFQGVRRPRHGHRMACFLEPIS